MHYRRNPVDTRMKALKIVKEFAVTRTALGTLMSMPYKESIVVLKHLESNKFIVREDKRLYLTLKGQRVLTRYNSLVKDLHIKTDL